MKLQKHHELHVHHRYQLEVIFLFAAGLFLFLIYYIIFENVGWSISRGQWYFFIPFIILYTTHLLDLRSEIKKAEKISPKRRHILYWVIFGILVITIHKETAGVSNLRLLDLTFLLFSLFLADSYWDFKK